MKGATELQVVRKYFQNYLKEIRSIYAQKNYTEMSFRTPLENFIESLNGDYELLQEPQRTKKLGAPDFRAYKGSAKVGYIETKDLGANLDSILESEQISKYKESISNLVVTNYLHFVLIRNSKVVIDLDLLDMAELDEGRKALTDQQIQKFMPMINAFFDYNLPTITSAEELAKELANRAKLLRGLAEEQLEDDIKNLERDATSSPSSVYDFFQGIRELIRDITPADCADAYAQTITYGLFLARINAKTKMEKETASLSIPQSIAIIRKIFSNIAEALPSNVRWIIDELIDILNASSIDKILTQIDERSKKDRDPFSYFYEDFLAQYNPKLRKRMGVYYTPRPVVSFIVNSVNSILRDHFDKKYGFADGSVTVLDPAVGTGTFLWMIYLLTLVELKNKGLGGIIRSKIANHILKDFYGFEILITPYIFAHLKLSTTLAQWHYQLPQSERVQVFLTNTLEPSESHGLVPFMRELNEESRIAGELKQRKKILVIVSNPPYSGSSANKGNWIQQLLKKPYGGADGKEHHGYFQIDGQPLGEKNPKWLQDDYVKFIRFAQWKIDMTGEGIVGFITNHGYLDNPTFRGMRNSLLESFSRIYILNLHGNSLKREVAPDGGKDENVFDIKPGVAIALFIKNRKFKERKIFYADLYGTRETKYAWLDRKRLNTVEWKEIEPRSPDYAFVPTETKNQQEEEEYRKWWSIVEIFPVYSVGIVTARDDFTIKWSSEEVWNVVSEFARAKLVTARDEEETRQKFGLRVDKPNWKVGLAHEDIVKSGPSRDHIIPILYRVFDTRYTYYTGKSLGFQCRPRPEVTDHMLHENLGIVFHRREELNVPYSHFFVADKMVEHCCLSIKTTCYIAPLYLYSNRNKNVNINPRIFDSLRDLYGQEVTAEDIFYYIYAVGYSPIYRRVFNSYLRMDFPRIPFVKGKDKFDALCAKGKNLVDLHLGRTKAETRVRFEVSGSNTVKDINYKDGRLYINDTQFFDRVASQVWEFRIGGYQVLDKWLKSRKNRELTSTDVEQFLNITSMIGETIELMKQIEKIDFLNDITSTEDR